MCRFAHVRASCKHIEITVIGIGNFTNFATILNLQYIFKLTLNYHIIILHVRKFPCPTFSYIKTLADLFRRAVANYYVRGLGLT